MSLAAHTTRTITRTATLSKTLTPAIRTFATARSLATTPRPYITTRTNTFTSPQQQTRAFSATMAEKKGVHNLKSKSEFDEAMGEKGSLMVLDCFATWCGPCKVIAPQVVKFSDTYPDARFYKLDVDEVPDVAQELSVRAMPTFMLFKDGEKVGEVVGANPVALEGAIKNHL